MAASMGLNPPQSLQEFTRYAPPGWPPYDETYHFKAHVQCFQLRWILTPLDEREAGPSMASRLLDRAFAIAMHPEVERDGVKCKKKWGGLALPRLDEERHADGNIVHAAYIGGALQLMQKLANAFDAHDQD